MNNVSLIGRLTKDPELKYLQNGGRAVARFSIAINREYSKQQKKEAEASGKQTADFINIIAWGKTAEFCANYIGKGNRVAIQGRIATGSYEDKDGKRVYTTDVVVYNINPIDWKNKTSGASEWDAIDEYPDDDVPF